MEQKVKKSRGVPKGAPRPWVAGKPKFQNGDLVKVLVLLSDKQLDFLKDRGNVSATLRTLVDREMGRLQKRTKAKS